MEIEVLERYLFLRGKPTSVGVHPEKGGEHLCCCFNGCPAAVRTFEVIEGSPRPPTHSNSHTLPQSVCVSLLPHLFKKTSFNL